MDTIVSLKYGNKYKTVDEAIKTLKPFDIFYVNELMMQSVKPLYFKDSDREEYYVNCLYTSFHVGPTVIDGEIDWESKWEITIKNRYHPNNKFSFMLNTREDDEPSKRDIALAFQAKVNSMAMSFIES
jgi:hypothetical protein